MPRIVSLLPSTTEILYALGADDQIVGVTLECDFPPQARSKPIVSTPGLPAGLPPAEIDAYVSAALARGEDLYHLDADALRELDPDVVVTQDLCAVCAVDTTVVDDALAYLGCRAEVVTIDPHTLEDVLASVLRLGELTGTVERAVELVADSNRRLSEVGMWAAESDGRPTVMLLEWTDPPFAPGHWIPQMIECAGGECILGLTGEKSYRVGWDDIAAAEPDVVIAAPCGYDLAGAGELARACLDRLPVDVPVWAVDANASFARPGTRLIDGVEALAGILHDGPIDDEMAARIR